MWCLDKVYKEGLRLEPVLIAQYKRKDATAITKHLLSYKQNSNGICFNPKLVSQHDFAALDCIVYRKPFCQGPGIIAEICIVLTPAQITPSGRALHIQCSSSSTIRRSLFSDKKLVDVWGRRATKTRRADCFWFLHSCVIHLLDCWHKYFIISWPLLPSSDENVSKINVAGMMLQFRVNKFCTDF